MDRDDIIRMAREASNNAKDALLENDDDIALLYVDELERFANLVAAVEREACAKVCEQLGEEYAYASEEHCAEAIRARGQE